MGLSKRCSVPSRLFILGAFFHKVFVSIYSRSLSQLVPFFDLFLLACIFFILSFWEILRISIPRPLIIGCLPAVLCDHIFYVLTYLFAIRGNTGAPVFSCEEHNKRTFICIYQKLLLPLHPKTINNDVRGAFSRRNGRSGLRLRGKKILLSY